MHERAQVLPPAATIGYLRVDARPVKQALLAWVTKWIFLFTNYLEGKVHGMAVWSCLFIKRHILHCLTPALPQVVGTMKELYSFTGSGNATLDLPVGNELSEGARASEACSRLWVLPCACGCMRAPCKPAARVAGALRWPAAAVCGDGLHARHPQALRPHRRMLRPAARHRAHRLPASSLPTIWAAHELARMQVALLLRCGISLSEAVLKQLEEAPLLWKALKKKMFYRCAAPLPSYAHAEAGAQTACNAGGSRCRTCSRPRR